MKEQWQGFKGSKWQDEVDVRDFIQNNYKLYNGDESFLEGPTESTNILWAELQKLQKEERAKGGVLDMETEVVSSLTAYGPGYLDKDLEKVVGLQTDKPLKRAFMPYGGIWWALMYHSVREGLPIPITGRIRARVTTISWMFTALSLISRSLTYRFRQRRHLGLKLPHSMK